MNQADHDVIVVGAGLAGLACAGALQQRGLDCIVLEAEDRPGGRIRTDEVDGFRLDRGFQVFLTAYPEARKLLDLEGLRLCRFQPGALIRWRGRFHEFADPWRRPLAALPTLFGPIGTFGDKLRLARFRRAVRRGPASPWQPGVERESLEELRSAGFSANIIERFLRPFLGGVFLDPSLATSSQMLRFVFRMFSEGDACLPAEGMEAIPRQLANRLKPGTLRLQCAARSLTGDSVTLADGRRLSARAVVVAVGGNAGSRLLQTEPERSFRSVTCLYFSARQPPVSRPVLVLNGEGSGPVNNLCVPTAVAPGYGPAGLESAGASGRGNRHLVSVTCLSTPGDLARLEAEVRTQMADWFGSSTAAWEHLRTYVIPEALPDQRPPALANGPRPARRGDGIFVCGDHTEHASIEGALCSGLRVADAVSGSLGAPSPV